MKNYFAKWREDRLIRKLQKLRYLYGSPVVQKLSRSVLYENDAYQVLRYYVNLTAESPLHEGLYDPKSNLLKLACGTGNDKNHYWLYQQDGLYYAVQIGLKSKIFIGRTSYIPYGNLIEGDIRIDLKDCRRDVWETLGTIFPRIPLYGYFHFGKDGLIPVALILEGEDVVDFNEGVWGAEVEYQEVSHILEGYDKFGRKGEWYDVFISPFSLSPLDYGNETMYQPWTTIHHRWWKGEKIIRQFDKADRLSLEDMLTIWELFIEEI